jgi:hypothetical protein
MRSDVSQLTKALGLLHLVQSAKRRFEAGDGGYAHAESILNVP